MIFMQVDIPYPNGVTFVFLSLDLDLNFQGQTFKVAILTCKRWKNANITIAIR